MSFLLWQRDQLGIASGQQVLRAAQVPLLQDASALVARLQALWQAESGRIEAAEESARRRGRAEGEERARVSAEAALAERLAALAHQAEAARDEARQQVAALALQVVRKLLGGLPLAESQAALALQAARELLPARVWRLAVHPDAAPALRERVARLGPEERAALAGGEVVEDASLAPDDCRLDTEFGSARAGLEAQLDRLAAAWGVVLPPAGGPAPTPAGQGAAG